jgi:hypothetical protein
MNNVFNSVTSLLLLVTFSFFSCKKNENNNNAVNLPATFTVKLVDAPVAYDKVFIDIQDIQVKASIDNNDTGWKSLTISRKGVYNILDFKNGLDTILGTTSLPAGNVSQIRLVLGSNNQVVYKGVRSNMTTPSSQQSGLKLLINASLLAGVDYVYWIDFDASKSIIHTGANNFILKPVIKVFTQANSGAIKGVVSPTSSKALIFAINNFNDTIGTTQIDTATGSFLLKGILAGNYKININVTNGLSKDSTKSNIIVANGQVNDLGTIILKN